eukprot:Hpha_TRINITY_DN16412_c0_g4::TRINITY_DN16412_c0_g4_i1::g.158889::m.158889
MNPLQCRNPRCDTLGWAWEEEVVRPLRNHGDEMLFFSGKGDFMYKDYSVVHDGALVLTDQALTLTDPRGAEKERIDNTNVLEVQIFEDTGYLRLETDEDDLLLKIFSAEESGWFVEAFQEDVLPIDATRIPSMAEYAAEKGLSAEVLQHVGLSVDAVKAAAKVDEVDLLEQQRDERLRVEKLEREEEERRQEEAKAAMRKQMERDKADAEEAHRRGMRRLSLKRRTAETVDRALRRHVALSPGSPTQPVWWEGAWSPTGDQEDPYLMPEDRLETMKLGIEREAKRLEEERRKRLQKLVDQLEGQEGHRRRMLDGEQFLALGGLREEWDEVAEENRKQEQALLSRVSRKVEALEKDQASSRVVAEAAEADERQRYIHSRDAQRNRLGGVQKLMRTTFRDEERMRDDIGHMEKRRWRDLIHREEKNRHRGHGKGRRSRGISGSASPRATGSRASYFAALSGCDKMSVIELTGEARPGQFAGRPEEALVRFFEGLPAALQSRSLDKFKRASRGEVEDDDLDILSGPSDNRENALLIKMQSIQRRNKLLVAGASRRRKSTGDALLGRSFGGGSLFSDDGSTDMDVSYSLSTAPFGLRALLPCSDSEGETTTADDRRSTLSVSPLTSRAPSPSTSNLATPRADRKAGRFDLNLSLTLGADGLLVAPTCSPRGRPRRGSTASNRSRASAARSPRATVLSGGSRSSPRSPRALSPRNRRVILPPVVRLGSAETPALTPEGTPMGLTPQIVLTPAIGVNAPDSDLFRILAIAEEAEAAVEAVPSPPPRDPTPPPFDPFAFEDFATARMSQFDRWKRELQQGLQLSEDAEYALLTAAAGGVLVIAAAVRSVVRRPSRARPGLSPQRGRAWAKNEVLAVRPAWCDRVVFTYTPVAAPAPAAPTAPRSFKRGGVRCPRSESEEPARSVRFLETEDPASPPRYNGGIGLSPEPSPSPGAWIAPSSPQRSRSNAQLRRNVSPLKGGGALCGGLIVKPHSTVYPYQRFWRSEY